MVGTRLGSRIGTVRIIGSLLGKQSVFVQRAINFIGGNMIEPFPCIVIFPDVPCGIEQVNRSDNIGIDKFHRIQDGAVNMRLGSQMNHSVKAIFFKKFNEELSVNNISLNKSVVWLFFNIFQIGKISRVSQFVEINDFIFRIFGYELADCVRTYKSRAAGY